MTSKRSIPISELPQYSATARALIELIVEAGRRYPDLNVRQVAQSVADVVEYPDQCSACEFPAVSYPYRLARWGDGAIRALYECPVLGSDHPGWYCTW